MKVTLNWLKEFVDINISPEELAEKLTNSGNEVEEIIYQNKYLHDVVVGKILEIKQHPNAEKLVICQVDIGEKITQIITAAKNIKENDLVPVSLPGASLANGINITASKLRGEDSFGMFCSVEELGVTDYDGDVNGIMILDNNLIPGTKIEDALMMNDVIFDINITPNRPDCMSIVGIAREISALLKVPFKEKDYKYNCDESDDVKNYVEVNVVDKQLCPRYMATAIKDIKIQKSPQWLRSKLVAVDIKPINNIVDITNYV
ncbi:MAG: phenylalanine--tRNA ligase subunit beta, partial [Clostridia bacterium]|nr:phenylalanine--tRNA ligase subunit beta [Clostridia bacterium]